MASNTIEKNIQIENTPPEEQGEIKNESVTTDVIVILDKSGSMQIMGNEPVQSVNAFLEEQKKDSVDDGAVFTFTTFNSKSEVIVDHIPIVSAEAIAEDSYKPDGGTALNDAVCFTIEAELKSDKPTNKVVLIITDGQENASQHYTTEDTRKMIADCQENHDWKFIFIGANIDAFATGHNISVDRAQCSQFAQNMPGDLLQMCRQTSCNVNDFRRARTDGFEQPELVAAPSMVYAVSCPVDEKDKVNAVAQMFAPTPLQRATAADCVYYTPSGEPLQFPTRGLGIRPGPIDDLDLLPLPSMLGRQTTGVGIY
jgi:Mg-chelatase subunit ChlD